MARKYKGWHIYYSPNDGSQNWGAVRFGVSVCCRTEAGLLAMIDARPKWAMTDR